MEFKFYPLSSPVGIRPNGGLGDHFTSSQLPFVFEAKKYTAMTTLTAE